MPRKLKAFVTSMGFYDLAIAAPSMKGALEAWGSNNNLFHQGFARQLDDPEIVAATMAKPGVVLRRPVGTNETFLEHANLPSDFELNKPAKRRHKPARRARPTANSSRKKVDDKTARKAGVKAAAAYEKERAKRDRERQRYEFAEAKKRERRDHMVKKAQAELEKAQQDHATRVAALDKERQRVEARMQAEESRWKKVEDRLKDAICRAGG